nr:hypothetical protein [Pseudomonadota bacterium]
MKLQDLISPAVTLVAGGILTLLACLYVASVLPDGNSRHHAMQWIGSTGAVFTLMLAFYMGQISRSARRLKDEVLA